MPADRERPEIFDLSLLRNRVSAVREAVETLETTGPQSDRGYLNEIRKQQDALQEVSNELWDVVSSMDEVNAPSGDATMADINAVDMLSKEVAALRLRMLEMVVKKRLQILETGKKN